MPQEPEETRIPPLVITGLLFAVLFRSLLRRRLPPRRTLVGAGLCVVGLAAFLAISRPPGGAATLGLGKTLLPGAALGAALVSCLSIALRRPGRVRALALALSGGLLFGAGATTAKVATATVLEGGPLTLLESWPLYALAALGPGGLLATEHAYRAHRDLGSTQAAITLTNLLVSITLGILWLHDNLRSSSLEIAGEVLGLVTLTTGVWLLAHHAALSPEAGTENQPRAARPTPSSPVAES